MNSADLNQVGGSSALSDASDTSADQIQVRVATRLEELDAIRDAWDRLMDSSEQPRPVNSYAWVSSFLEHCLDPDEKWLCLQAWQDGRLIGILPLVEQRRRWLGRSAPVLRSPGDNDTSSMEMLVESGHEAVVLTNFLKALDQYVPGWLGLAFTRLLPDSAILRQCERGLSGAAAIIDLNGYGRFFRVSGSFEERFSAMRSKYRSNVRRSRRLFHELDGAREVIVNGGEASGAAVEEFLDLEASGWKGREGTAIRTSPGMAQFYASLSKKLAARGQVTWRFLLAEGRLIGGQMEVRTGSVLQTPKLAHDEAYARCSPGQLVVDSMLQWAHGSSDLKEIDCLTDVDWLDPWLARRRPYYDVWITPLRFSSMLAGHWPRKLKHLMRDVPGLKKVIRAARRISDWS